MGAFIAITQDNPKLSALVSFIESTVIFSLATFALNLGDAFQVAATQHLPFAFDWKLQGYMVLGALCGAIGKGIVTYIGASQAQKAI